MPNDAKKNRGQQKKITDELDNELKSIKSKKAFEQWMKENPVGSQRFSDYLSELCEDRNMRLADLVRAGICSKAHVYACGNGTKNPSRAIVIRIALGIHASLEETNRLLMLAGLRKLYSKKREEAILIYGINNGYTVEQIVDLLESEHCDTSFLTKG